MHDIHKNILTVSYIVCNSLDSPLDCGAINAVPLIQPQDRWDMKDFIKIGMFLLALLPPFRGWGAENPSLADGELADGELTETESESEDEVQRPKPLIKRTPQKKPPPRGHPSVKEGSFISKRVKTGNKTGKQVTFPDAVGIHLYRQVSLEGEAPSMTYQNTLGLLGVDVADSISPWIHTAAAKAVGLPYKYELFSKSAEEVVPFLEAFWREGGIGLNVTKPYKPVVAHQIDSPLLALNTLFRGNSSTGWEGLSSDGLGFSHAIEAHFGRGRFTHVVILGNGGVVFSLLEALRSQEKSPRVTVLRRDSTRDVALQAVDPEVSFMPFTPTGLREAFSKAPHLTTLLVQASSAPAAAWEGFKGEIDVFSGGYMDLAYGDRVAPLFSWMKTKGQPCEDGLLMLLEQARISESAWWGEAPGLIDLLRAMEEVASSYEALWTQYKPALQKILIRVEKLSVPWVSPL
jgi:shikimate dehydrogenase